MVSNIPNSTYVKGGESYSNAPEGSGATAKTAGKEGRNSNIPLQVWQERAGRAMNILQEKVRFKVDPAKGEVVMVTGSTEGGAVPVTGNSGNLTDGVINPVSSAKGSLINKMG